MQRLFQTANKAIVKNKLHTFLINRMSNAPQECICFKTILKAELICIPHKKLKRDKILYKIFKTEFHFAHYVHVGDIAKNYLWNRGEVMIFQSGYD